MKSILAMPLPGLIVCAIIVVLFLLAVALLFRVCGRYRRLITLVSEGNDRNDAFLCRAVDDFSNAYATYGDQVNTPAIISGAVSSGLRGALFCERFLNNAVSLFVTLGLFGTFMGLSLSVSSLTELISYSNTSEWLSVLDSVGGGLMSALSGMGVAFYTSLVGAACSILLTILRSIFSPAAMRESMETSLELYLDNEIAPTLPVTGGSDDVSLVRRLIDTLNGAADSMEKSMAVCTQELRSTISSGNNQLAAFNRTVNSFNEGVRDFSEFNYNLRGTVERMDVSVRDLVGAMRRSTREMEKGGER